MWQRSNLELHTCNATVLLINLNLHPHPMQKNFDYTVGSNISWHMDIWNTKRSTVWRKLLDDFPCYNVEIQHCKNVLDLQFSLKLVYNIWQSMYSHCLDINKHKYQTKPECLRKKLVLTARRVQAHRDDVTSSHLQEVIDLEHDCTWFI